jgi:hypothetical protein
MAAVDRKPILFTDGLVDVTYMCDWCGTETKRAVREPGLPAAPATANAAGWSPSAGCGRNRRRKAARRACRQRPSEYGSSKRPDAKSFG